MTGNCELTVAGSVARSVLDAIGTRFDVLAVRPTTRPADRATGRPVDRTVLTVVGVDQSAVRALMIMLWDSGHDVLAMSTVTLDMVGVQPRSG